jgi:1-acyl-sn-glycerol-3-phosphate acyltransferase
MFKLHSEQLMDEALRIDVRRVLTDKNPGLAKRLPGFLIRYLERLIHQDDLNEILRRFGHLKDNEFITPTLDFMGIRYTSLRTENIPQSGRFIFASNHPLGGLDGLVFINEVSKTHPNVRFPVNDILLNLTNMSGIFLPVNKHGLQGRDTARITEEAYASDDQILYFPAGICSRRRGGIIADIEWHKSFISKAIKHKRDVIPVYFSGRNSDFFYRLANIRAQLGIKVNIEMLFLPHEMFKQKGNDICLVFGEPIPWQSFDKSQPAAYWAAMVRKRSYELAGYIKDCMK